MQPSNPYEPTYESTYTGVYQGNMPFISEDTEFEEEIYTDLDEEDEIESDEDLDIEIDIDIDEDEPVFPDVQLPGSDQEWGIS